MSDPNEDMIRERAYALWEKEGSPHGRDLEFWERARLMVEAEPAEPPTSAPHETDSDKDIDAAMEGTFPASDPPSFTADVGAGRRSR